MFKRITWMGIGMAVGATGAFRAKRKVEEAIDRYLPEQVADRAAASARGLGEAVRAAATEGREAMKATEEELRSRVEARTYVGERGDGTGSAFADGAAAGTVVPLAASAAGTTAEPAARSVDRPTRPDAPGPRRIGRTARALGGGGAVRRRPRR